MTPCNFPFGYAKDCEVASSSIRTFGWLLRVLVNRTENVYILLGSRIVSHCIMNMLENQRYWHNIGHIKRIKFKQPDIDTINLAIMCYNAEKIPNANSIPIVIYAHPGDRVLQISTKLHYGDRRVGMFAGNENGVRQMKDFGVTFINATQYTRLISNGHWYFDSMPFKDSLKMHLDIST